MNMKIKIFTTGGTIDKIYFDQKSEYQVGDPQAKGVLEKANVVVDYEVESIRPGWRLIEYRASLLFNRTIYPE